MKKLLTLALLCSTMLGSYAQDLMTDQITGAEVKTAFSGNGNITTSSNQSGAAYKLLSGEMNYSYLSTQNYWSFKNSKTTPGIIASTTSGGNVRSVTIYGKRHFQGSSSTQAVWVCASNSEITASNYASSPVYEVVLFTASNYTGYTTEITGDYKYVAIVVSSSYAPNFGYGDGTSSSAKSGPSFEIKWEEAAKQCEMPTIGDVQYLFPETELTLSSEEGSTMTYSYGVSEEYPNADSVTGTDATSDANSATVTVPADATVGYYFWVKATAEKEGCVASEPLFWTQRIISKKLAAPTFNLESGEIDRGSVLYINRPSNATTIHYTVNGGDEQTSTDYSVQLTINETTTVTAYATGDAPFEKSETVTREFTTVTPTLATPELYPTSDIRPGQSLYLNVYGVPENTVLTYSWGVRNGETDIVKDENVVAEGTSATITVPADVEIGYELWVNAQATLENYNPSEELNFTYTFEGIQLSAPTFSLASGENLMAGVETTIYLPANATTLHYTISGGEEQTSNENVTLTINEDMEVVAWATGTGLYTESAKATASYKLEVIPDNVDVLYPTDWSTFSAGDYQYAERGEYTSPKTGVTYVFNGAFDVIDGVNTFYFSGQDCVLYNTTGKKITGIRLDTPKTSGNFMYVGLSTDAALTTGGTSTIGFYDASNYGVWYNPQDYKNGAEYFSVWSYSGQVSRILVEYDIDTAVKSLNAEEAGEEVYYNLQGVRVANPENGIFIRVQNGKTTKVMK